MYKVANEKLEQARSKIEIIPAINIDLPKTHVPAAKIVLKLEAISFLYPNSTQPLIDRYSLIIKGAERIAIQGKNGAGKTTLVKIIQGLLKPKHGQIYCGVSELSYLDQGVQIFDVERTLLENFQIMNPDVNEVDARRGLANFLFRNQSALKLIRDLSGGERLRAALACLLLSNHPPQLLILDEPTNHLDLESIVALESALNCYQGTLIVISHDETFVESIKIQRVLKAPFI